MQETTQTEWRPAWARGNECPKCGSFFLYYDQALNGHRCNNCFTYFDSEMNETTFDALLRVVKESLEASQLGQAQLWLARWSNALGEMRKRGESALWDDIVE